MVESMGRRSRVIAEILAVSEAGLSPESVTDHTTLRGDLGLNSLQAVTLVLNLEEIYGIVVEEERLATMGTVGDVLRLIDERLPERGTSPA
jgi:acyl carrier protein